MNRPALHREPFPGIDDYDRSLRGERIIRPAPPEIILEAELADAEFNVAAEPITASRLVGAFALALVALVVIYFGGHFLWAALS